MTLEELDDDLVDEEKYSLLSKDEQRHRWLATILGLDRNAEGPALLEDWRRRLQQQMGESGSDAHIRALLHSVEAQVTLASNAGAAPSALGGLRRLIVSLLLNPSGESVVGYEFSGKISLGEVKARFARLVTQWKEQTQFESSATKRVMHRAYQQIIGLGPAAVPLLLGELVRAPDHWFWALLAITGDDPVPESDRGNLAKMTDAWLRWGRDHGFQC